MYGYGGKVKIDPLRLLSKNWSTTVLALYSLKAKTNMYADTSNFGLGAVLFQKQQSVWKPVVYVSCTMSETKQRYSQM